MKRNRGGLSVQGNVLIHVGFPKTATTWFQKSFFPYVKNSRFVPRMEVLKPAMVYPDPLEFESVLAEEALRNYTSEKHLIISDEAFLSKNGFFIKEYALRFKEHFKNPQIIIFIRNQESMLASKYTQYVKANGGTYSLRSFLFGLRGIALWRNRAGFNNMALLNYDAIISFYKNVFGAENVHVFLFEDFVVEPEVFSRLFAEKFDLDVDWDCVSFAKQNEGLRRGLIGINRFVNLFTRETRFEKHYIVHIPFVYYVSVRLIKRLNKLSIFGKPFAIKNALSKKDYDKVLNFYRESNRQLISKHGLSSIADYGYPL